MAQLTEEQRTQAIGVIAGVATELLNGNTVQDADRIKAARLHGLVIQSLVDNGTVTDDDVVRSDAVLMLAGGASIGEVIKYLVDCLTGNPIAPPATLVDDDDDLLTGLGTPAPDATATAAPHQAPTPPQPQTAFPIPTPPATGRGGRRGPKPPRQGRRDDLPQ